MDREAGIEAYQAMITAEEYKARLLRADDSMIHRYTADGESPVIQVEITRAQASAEDVSIYEFRSVDGGDLPAWEAGAHLDIVVAPEFLRQYSMSGDPADPTKYQIGVLRENEGRGGSALLHRIFHPGRRLFVSRPINHFPLDPQADKVILMGGGIGVTPLIAMAHQLHAQKRDFVLHYSGRSRHTMAYLDEIASFNWHENVTTHISDEGSCLALDTALTEYRTGCHVYTCGAARYMNSVLEAARQAGFPEESLHLEYFSVPETSAYENNEFTLKLARSGTQYTVPFDKSAADVLNENNLKIDIKCSDGICGVCKCGLISGDVEHRDFVLSREQRKTHIILCQSRAAHRDGVITIDR